MFTFKVNGNVVKDINTAVKSAAVGFGARQVDRLLQKADLGPIGNIAVAGGIQGALNTGSLSGALRGGVQGVLQGAVGGLVSNAGAALQGAVGQLSGQLGGALTGQIQGALNGALGNIQGSLNNALGGALGNPLGGLLGGGGLTSAAGAFGAGGLPGPSGAAGGTYSGTAPSSDIEPVRTAILDPAKANVTIMVDSFLQGLAGSLSSIGGIGGILGSAMQGALGSLLSSTGLSGALGKVTEGLNGALSGALSNMSSALGNVAGNLVNGLGNAISNIPAIGPAFNQFTQGVGNFMNNVNNAFNSLPTDAQQIVSGISRNIGANLVDRALNKRSTNRTQNETVVKNLEFQDNPTGQLRDIAVACTMMDKKVYKETQDPVFGILSNAANKAAEEMERSTFIKNNGTYGLRRQTQEELVENIQKCVDGQIVEIPIDQYSYNLRQPILDSYANLDPRQQLREEQARIRAAAIKAIELENTRRERPAVTREKQQEIRNIRTKQYLATANNTESEAFLNKVETLNRKYGKRRADLYVDFIVGTDPVNNTEVQLTPDKSLEDRIQRARRISSFKDIETAPIVFPLKDRFYTNESTNPREFTRRVLIGN